MQGFLALSVAVAVTLAVGVLVRRSGHRLGRRSRRSATKFPTVLAPGDLGGTFGERATLVQFSTAFCQPCRATRRVLADVASKISGVRHVEVDAESHLELVRRLDIRRTPTVLVLDAGGRVVRRASGQPRAADVIAAVGETVDA